MTLALTKTTTVEAKLFVRDPGSIVFALLFPAGLLYVLGTVMPGFLDPIEEAAGQRAIDIYLPVVIAIAIATTAVTVMPATIAMYRERRLLRRLATTPASPAGLLVAQILVNLAATAVAIGLAIMVGLVVFDVRMAENPAGLAIAFVLGTAAMFGLGTLIAAVAPTTRVASGLGMMIYFPLLFFAGVWTPGDAMPEGIAQVAQFTPLGAAAQAFHDTWAGAWPEPLHMAVMAGYLIVSVALASRLFRWS